MTHAIPWKFRMARSRCVAIAALGGLAQTGIASAQAADDGLANGIQFDLAAEPLVIGLEDGGAEPSSLRDRRIESRNGLSLNGNARARSLVSTPPSDILRYDDESMSQLDLQLGNDSGFSLIGSFGLSSQPREQNPGDIFFLRGNTIREERAVANIGLRF
jgi:hypothetical protein